MQVDPAVAGDVEGFLPEQCAVGHHRAAVGGELAEPVEEGGVVGPRGFEDFDSGFGGAARNRAGDEAAAPSCGRIGPGHDRDDLVLGGE